MRCEFDICPCRRLIIAAQIVAMTLSAIPRLKTPPYFSVPFPASELHLYTYTPIGRNLNKRFGKTPVRAVEPSDETCQGT